MQLLYKWRWGGSSLPFSLSHMVREQADIDRRVLHFIVMVLNCVFCCRDVKKASI